MDSKDLIGHDLTADEREVMAINERIRALAAKPDLAPCMAANLSFAAASLAQIITDLGLDWGHPDL
ncbi:MAG: hypothetical protein KDB53_17775 [Planctomycetes bacterium]|nr:hypothetical protein [Planctomycetota bacterium]